MSNFFKARRDELGKTQFEIAVEMGVTPAAVSAWERNENPPKLKHAPKLALAYKVSERRATAAIVEMNKQPAGRAS